MPHTETLAALASDSDAELTRLTGEVRRAPGDAKLRTYLFQLLALRGTWDRALSQLQVAAQLSPLAIPMAQAYREAIRCEVYRAEVFAGQRQPSLLGTPPAWAGPLLEALKLFATGRVADAETLRADALDAAPATPGTIDGVAFEWIADMDSRIGPMCEAFVDGKYVWIPFEHIAALKIDPPADLRDLVWAGAELTFANGGTTVAMIPSRYPGSHAASDGALRMARKTAWTESGEDTFVGQGQRMWATDAGEYAMLDVRSIVLTPAPAAA